MQKMLFHGFIGSFWRGGEDGTGNFFVFTECVFNNLFFAHDLSELQHEYRELVFVDEFAELIVFANVHNRLMEIAIVDHEF